MVCGRVMVLGPVAADKSALCMLLASQFDLPLVTPDLLLAAALQDPSSTAGESWHVTEAIHAGQIPHNGSLLICMLFDL